MVRDFRMAGAHANQRYESAMRYGFYGLDLQPASVDPRGDQLSRQGRPARVAARARARYVLRPYQAGTARWGGTDFRWPHSAPVRRERAAELVIARRNALAYARQDGLLAEDERSTPKTRRRCKTVRWLPGHVQWTQHSWNPRDQRTWRTSWQFAGRTWTVDSM